jgi:predicted RNase H-like HicB family nuclease
MPSKKAVMRTYTVVVHEAEPDETGFWAEVEELPGCFASGDSLDELEADVRDAIETYIAALEDLGQPVPEGRKAVDEGLRRWEIAVAL